MIDKTTIRVIGLMIFSGCMTAWADDEPTSEDIEPQPLNEALREFADRSGLQVVYRTELAAGIETAGTDAPVDEHEALDQLLASTGLAYRFINDRTVAIQAVDTEPARDPGNARPASRLVLMAQTLVEQNQIATTAVVDATNERREEPDLQIEEIIVTGTNIRGVRNPTTPTLQFDREDIDLSGAATVEDFLRTIPQNFSSENVISADSANPFSNGNNSIQAAAIDLRGLGAGSTLTLLNGRRLSPVGTISFVDVNILPLGAIERVDVQTDGASAIYGSDAVGGVVNFVTRKDYEGFEVNARYGTVTSGSKEDFGIGAAGGLNWDSGGVFFGVDYLEEKPLLSSERDFIDPILLDENGTFGSETDRFSLAGSINQSISSRAVAAVDVMYSDRTADSVSNAFPGLSIRTNTGQEAFSINSKIDFTIIDGLTSTLYFDYGENTITQRSSNSDFVSERINDLVSVEAQVSGTLFELPGGGVSFAAGGLYRDEGLDVARDNEAGDIIQDVQGNRDISAIYAEVLVPIVGESNELPYIQELYFSAAGRYEDYSDFGDTLDPKIGLYWGLNDQFSLRASYSESFRAPDLSTVNSPQSFSVSTIPSSFFTAFDAPETDPRFDGTIFEGLSPVLTLLSGGSGNPDLKEETAQTWSAGFTYEPSFISGLSLHGNFFDISYKNRIEAIFFAEILRIPDFAILAELPPNLAEIEGVFAAAEAGEIELSTIPIPPFPFVVQPEDIQMVLNAGTQNLSERDVQGIDFNLAYSTETGFGQFSGTVNLTYTFDFIGRVSELAEPVEQVNLLYRPIDLNLRGSIAWSRNGLTVFAAVNHIGSYRDDLDSSIANDVDAWTTSDLSLMYNTEERFDSVLLDNIRLGLNVQNLFDEDPPFVQTREGFNFDPVNADPFGRMIAFTVRKQF